MTTEVAHPRDLWRHLIPTAHEPGRVANVISKTQSITQIVGSFIHIRNLNRCAYQADLLRPESP